MDNPIDMRELAKSHVSYLTYYQKLEKLPYVLVFVKSTLPAVIHSTHRFGSRESMLRFLEIILKEVERG